MTDDHDPNRAINDAIRRAAGHESVERRDAGTLFPDPRQGPAEEPPGDTDSPDRTPVVVPPEGTAPISGSSWLRSTIERTR